MLISLAFYLKSVGTLINYELDLIISKISSNGDEFQKKSFNYSYDSEMESLDWDYHNDLVLEVSVFSDSLFMKFQEEIKGSI